MRCSLSIGADVFVSVPEVVIWGDEDVLDLYHLLGCGDLEINDLQACNVFHQSRGMPDLRVEKAMRSMYSTSEDCIIRCLAMSS